MQPNRSRWSRKGLLPAHLTRCRVSRPRSAYRTGCQRSTSGGGDTLLAPIRPLPRARRRVLVGGNDRFASTGKASTKANVGFCADRQIDTSFRWQSSPSTVKHARYFKRKNNLSSRWEIRYSRAVVARARSRRSAVHNWRRDLQACRIARFWRPRAQGIRPP
jgi:hypothetical protein